MMINESRRSRAHFDLPLVLLVFGLAAFGVLAVSVATFSTSSAEEDKAKSRNRSKTQGQYSSTGFAGAPSDEQSPANRTTL